MNRTPSAGSIGTATHFHKNGISDTSTPNNNPAAANGDVEAEDPYGKLQVEVNMHELLEEPVEELVSDVDSSLSKSKW